MVTEVTNSHHCGNTAIQNLRDAAKAVLRRKCIEINAYVKKKKELRNGGVNNIADLF